MTTGGLTLAQWRGNMQPSAPGMPTGRGGVRDVPQLRGRPGSDATGDIAFELFDDELLLRQHRVDQIADGYDADYP